MDISSRVDTERVHRVGSTLIKYPYDRPPCNGPDTSESLALITPGNTEMVELKSTHYGYTPPIYVAGSDRFWRTTYHTIVHPKNHSQEEVMPILRDRIKQDAGQETHDESNGGVLAQEYGEYFFRRNKLIEGWDSLPGQNPLVSKFIRYYVSHAYDGPHIHSLEQLADGSEEVGPLMPMAVNGSTVTYTTESGHFYRVHFYSDMAASHFYNDIISSSYGTEHGVIVVPNLRRLVLIQAIDARVGLRLYDDCPSFGFLTAAAISNGNEVYLHMMPEAGYSVFAKLMQGLPEQKFRGGHGVLEMVSKIDKKAVIDSVVKGEIGDFERFSFPVRRAA